VEDVLCLLDKNGVYRFGFFRISILDLNFGYGGILWGGFLCTLPRIGSACTWYTIVLANGPPGNRLIASSYVSYFACLSFHI
jgi:hypothetical protein